MHLGSRKLAIETLDPRLCLAFGDLAPGYAEVSYEQEASNWQTIQGFFEQGDDYTQVVSVLSGSGPGIVLASTDESGALTELFGGDGLAYVKDGVYDEFRLSKRNTIQLSDGSFVARVESAASQSRRLISDEAEHELDFEEIMAPFRPEPSSGITMQANGESETGTACLSLWKPWQPQRWKSILFHCVETPVQMRVTVSLASPRSSVRYKAQQQ